MYELNQAALIVNLRQWLAEDIGSGDITSLTTIPPYSQSTGIIHVKDDGIVAGLPVAEAVFQLVDEQLSFKRMVEDGTYITKGTVIAEVRGNTRNILMGERLALNLLQRLSGIATRTRQFVDALDGLPTRLVDTRKTTPGHRMLEKYAVRVGGGFNHRLGLFDAVMIKDNHIKGAGSIKDAIQAARRDIPHTMKIEVEVEDFFQLEEAIQAQADIIMLDNMIPTEMTRAVAIIKSRSPHIIVEASGTVTLQTIKNMALTGVDVISVGRLTYSVQALDISLDLNAQKGTRS